MKAGDLVKVRLWRESPYDWRWNYPSGHDTFLGIIVCLAADPIDKELGFYVYVLHKQEKMFFKKQWIDVISEV